MKDEPSRNQRCGSYLSPESGSGIERSQVVPSSALSEQEPRWQLDLATLTDVSLVLNSILDPEEVFRAIVLTATRVIDCQELAIFDLDPSGTMLSLRMSHGLSADFVQAAQCLPVDSCWMGSVRTGEVMVVSDIAADPHLAEFFAMAKAKDLRAFVDLPLVVRDRTVGCLVLCFAEPCTFTEFELELLAIFANQAALALHNARLCGRLERRVRGLSGPAQADAFGQREQSLVAPSAIEDVRQYDTVLQERHLIQTILASMTDGVVVTDASDNVVMCNQAAEEMLDIRAGRRWALEQASEEPVGWARALVRGNGLALVRGQWQITLERDGRILGISTTPLAGDEGEKQGAVTVIRDRTRWTELDQIKSDFISLVSHELRTPLTTIKTLVSLLKRKQRSEEEREYLDVIDSEVNRQVKLVDDLLEVGRLEAGDVEWTLGEVSMNDVIEQAVRVCLPLAREKRIVLIRQRLPALPKVMGTLRRLQQVLINLLVNAVKYTPSGGRVSVEAGSDQDTVWVAVSDTGPGIPKSDLPYVFDKFYQIRRRGRKQEGVGLGLAIAWQIVEASKGTIEVESEEGSGSCFTVRLPRARKIVAAMRERWKEGRDEGANSIDRR